MSCRETMGAHRAGENGHITGLKINAPMLSIARELATGSNIAWIERDVSETGLNPDALRSSPI